MTMNPFNFHMILYILFSHLIVFLNSYGGESTAIEEFEITMQTLNVADGRNITLRLYWYSNVYECTITPTKVLTTYSYDRSYFSVIENNCSESAFAVEFDSSNDAAGILIDSLRMEDANGKLLEFKETVCISAPSVLVDFIQPQNQTAEIEVNIYEYGVDSGCFDASGTWLIAFCFCDFLSFYNPQALYQPLQPTAVRPNHQPWNRPASFPYLRPLHFMHQL